MIIAPDVVRNEKGP